MGDRSNNIITKEFTYNVPDDYLAQTNTDANTATWTYEGPDYMYVFANEDTNLVHTSPVYTIADDGDIIPTPVGYYKIEIDTTISNHMPTASIAYQNIDWNTLPKSSETLPDGSVYQMLDPLPPHEAYETSSITYDRETNTFTYPWNQPHSSWDRLVSARNSLLGQSDEWMKDADEYTADQLTELTAYRQSLRNLTTTFSGIDPHKVPFPIVPSFLIETIEEGE